MTLYELTSDYLRLMEMASDPDIDAEVLADTMEGIEGAFEDKADGYAIVIDRLKGEAELIDKEIKRLTTLKQTKVANADRIKKNLEQSMKATGKTKFETLTRKFAIVKNGGKLPLVANEGVTVYDLPFELVKTKVEPDMDAIRTYLDNGGSEYYHYGERGESLRIK